jgi:glutamine amidotransferase
MLILTDNWVSVPANSIVTIHKQTVVLHPIMDEFYSEDLNQDRSSCYAVSKGLVSTAPGTMVPPQNNENCNQVANTDLKAPAIQVNGSRLDVQAGGLA